MVNYQNPYDTKCLRQNEKYAKIGETVRMNGFEFSVLEVKYGDTYNLLYDMFDKEKADKYISYLKPYSFFNCCMYASNGKSSDWRQLWLEVAHNDGILKVFLTLVMMTIWMLSLSSLVKRI